MHNLTNESSNEHYPKAVDPTINITTHARRKMRQIARVIGDWSCEPQSLEIDFEDFFTFGQGR